MLVQQKFDEAGLVAEAEHAHESVTWTMIVLLTLVCPCTDGSDHKEETACQGQSYADLTSQCLLQRYHQHCYLHATL